MEHRYYKFQYLGRGLELFRIQLVNIILTVLTLGLYYPWAKARTLSYLYSQTHFEDSPFSFTGTGKEMFKGFIKAFVLILSWYALLIYALTTEKLGLTQLVLLGFYVFLIALTPFILHSSYRYRMAKSNWRGIRFGYVGERKELVKIFLKGIFFTIITLGFYGPWLTINVRRYMLSNIRVGNAGFRYDADGSEYFWLNFKGYFLTIFTFGIYFFWWQRDIFRYFVNNLHIEQEERALFLHSSAEAVDFFELIVINMLIVVFSFGLGSPWATTRTMNFLTRNILINGYIAFDELQQAQESYNDATGEEFSDLLDFGFVI